MAITQSCYDCATSGYSYGRSRMSRIYLRDYIPPIGPWAAKRAGVEARKSSQKFVGAGWVCSNDRTHIKWDAPVGKPLTGSQS